MIFNCIINHGDHNNQKRKMKPLPLHTEPLTVVVRVRPMNNREIGAKTIVHPVDDKLIVLLDPHDDNDDILRVNRSREKQYIFDHIFYPNATQEEVYYAAVEEKNIIESVLSGHNCTVFAYGATGTGKTYTMLGSQEEPGIMVHTLNNLFKRIEETKDEMEYQVSMGYLEIYNECIRDLLCPDSGILDLREDSSGSIVVSNLLDISASSTDVVLGMLRMGNTNRTSEPTVANVTSSRSHAILKVNIEQRSRTSSIMQEVRCGSLYMVDLAGSERAAVTQNRGKRMIEGAHINRSLLALANCINALGSSNTNYINYRDSKLTRLLKEALGGNCKTVMIAHVSPASSSYEETRNTMVYAERTKKIKNKARQNVLDVNHHITQYLYIIEDQQNQISKLKEELNKTTVSASESSEVMSLCEELKALALDQREIRHKLLDLECHLLQNALNYQKHLTCIREWEQKRDFLDLEATTAPSSIPSPLLTPNSDPPVTEITSKPPITDICIGMEPTNIKELGSITNQVLSSGEHPDVISLKKAGAVASSSEFQIMDESTVPATVTQEEDCTNFGNSTGIRSALYKTGRIACIPNHSLVGLLSSVSPDSGTEMSVTATEPMGMEPPSVSTAREEVANLGTAKQKIEAQHSILEKQLRENKANIAEVKDKLSDANSFLPMNKEMIDLLQLTSDLEASRVEHKLSSMVMGIHISKHTSLIDQLLQHSATLLGILERQRALMLEEGRAEVPEDLAQQFGELSDKQKRLASQVADIKDEPVLDRELMLPSISKLSDKLYTKVTGSKSNLLILDEAFNNEQQNTSLVSHTDTSSFIPRISSPKHTSLPNKSTVDFSSGHFLPLISNNRTSMAAPYNNKLSLDSSLKTFRSSLKKSDITQILEAAKKSRDDKNAAGLGLDRFGRVKKQPKFTFASSRYKYNAPQISTIPCDIGTTEVIDLESGDDSAIHLKKTKSYTSLKFQSSKSQPHLYPSPFRKSLIQKTERNQKFYKPKYHACEPNQKKLNVDKSVVGPREREAVTKKAGSTHTTPRHKHSEEAHIDSERKTHRSTLKPIAKKSTFTKLSNNIKQNGRRPRTPVHSVYKDRPYILPVAPQMFLHDKSSQGHNAIKNKSTKKKRTTLNPHHHTVRTRHPSQRKELIMAKVKPDSQFSSTTTPYFSSPVKTDCNSKTGPIVTKLFNKKTS